MFGSLTHAGFYAKTPSDLKLGVSLSLGVFDESSFAEDGDRTGLGHQTLARCHALSCKTNDPVATVSKVEGR